MHNFNNNIYSVIRNPVVTEKTTKIAENNQFVFRVSLESSKARLRADKTLSPASFEHSDNL